MKKILVCLLVVISIVGCKSNTMVEIKTTEGNMLVELYDEKAPLTVFNFLNHIDNGLYDGSCFYRVVNENNQDDNNIKIAVIQGGLFDDALIEQYKPIEHETTAQTGILHIDGTISMARLEPGTASTEFFICIGTQRELDHGGMRNPDGQGFAAFGKVVKGMDVVRRIHSKDNTNQMLSDKVSIVGIRCIKP